MKYIYVDDLRSTPAGNIYDEHFKTVNDTLKYIRNAYKAGTTNFFLDLDHDASDTYSPEGGDYIEMTEKKCKEIYEDYAGITEEVLDCVNGVMKCGSVWNTKLNEIFESYDDIYDFFFRCDMEGNHVDK